MKLNGLLGFKAIVLMLSLSFAFSYLNYKNALVTEQDLFCTVGVLESSDSAGRGGGRYVRLKPNDFAIEIEGEVRIGVGSLTKLGEEYYFCFIDNFSFNFVIPDSRGYVYFLPDDLERSDFTVAVVARSNYHERHGFYLNFISCLFFYFFIVLIFFKRDRY